MRLHHQNKIITIVVILSLPLLFQQQPDGSDFAKMRRDMVKQIADEAKETSITIDNRAMAPGVLEAMGRVPRHEFVPWLVRGDAYENRPLPIGHGQTISQPYIVALMTDLAKPRPSHKVLEIGTGSGYQAAVLAELVDHVYTIEIIEPLGSKAKQRLHELGYDNVTTRIGDGYYGWDEHAPFDSIIVTAAASHIPPPLLKQLKVGGRMVIPVGSRFMTQQLVVVEKEADESYTLHQLLPVRFVPLTGDHEVESD